MPVLRHVHLQVCKWLQPGHLQSGIPLMSTVIMVTDASDLDCGCQSSEALDVAVSPAVVCSGGDVYLLSDGQSGGGSLCHPSGFIQILTLVAEFGEGVLSGDSEVPSAIDGVPSGSADL